VGRDQAGSTVVVVHPADNYKCYAPIAAKDTTYHLALVLIGRLALLDLLEGSKGSECEEIKFGTRR
jgi:hypothetical protein